MRPATIPASSARWPERLIAICNEFRAGPAEPRRQELLADAWLLANAALHRYVRLHSQAYPIDPEDAGDIASEKSLAFVTRLLDSAESFDASEPARVCAYLSTLARNGLIDHIRRGSRERHLDGSAPAMRPAADSSDPEARLARDEFAGALKGAILGLASRTRTMWFFRVMLHMSSREIACHPEVRMSTAAVDMALSRARRSIRESMTARGFVPNDIPPGTLAILWECLRHGNEHGEER